MSRSRRQISSGSTVQEKSELQYLELDVEQQQLVEGMQAAAREEDVRGKLQEIEKQLNDTFIARQDAIRVILLGVVSRQNYILIGTPGTAKTAVIDTFVKHVRGSTRFKTLMGRFTQPDHVFGVLDINAFKQGRYETVVTGMLPDAQLPILDEVLKASDGCMNSLLGALGPEREFQGRRTNNICVGGATNWPEVETLSKHVEALYDRFLLRCSVEAVDRSDKDARRLLYRAAVKVEEYTPSTTVSVDDLKLAALGASRVVIADVILDMLDGLIGLLMAPTKGPNNSSTPSGIEISDRRATQLQTVLKANAWLDGRTHVTIEDFDVLRHGLWSKRQHVESVAATLEVIDGSELQKLTKRIDSARQEFKAMKSSGFPMAGLEPTLEKIKSAAKDVKVAMEAPIFTKRSRETLKVQMLALKQDYEALLEVIKRLRGEVSRINTGE